MLDKQKLVLETHLFCKIFYMYIFIYLYIYIYIYKCFHLYTYIICNVFRNFNFRALQSPGERLGIFRYQ